MPDIYGALPSSPVAEPLTASAVGFKVSLLPAQTGDGYELLDSSGDVLWKVDALGNLSTVALPAPVAAVAALKNPAAAGNVDNGAHTYKVTFTNANGETTAGTGVVATVVDKTVNGQVSLTAIPTGPNGVTGRNVYRSKAGTTTPLFLLTSLADNTTAVYTDNSADSGLPATQPPTRNTSEGQISVGDVTVTPTTATAAGIGGNGAAPAQVAGYLQIVIAGTTYKVPYYPAS